MVVSLYLSLPRSTCHACDSNNNVVYRIACRGEHKIIRNPSVWTVSTCLLLYLFSPTSLSLGFYLFSLMFFYVQHEAHLFKEKPGPFLLVAFEVSSLCALSWCASQPHGFCLAFTQLLNHHFDSLLSVFFPPSSASSQSPAADPRKSCCFSVLAYVIPTYLYVILCNVFCCSSNTPNNIPASTALCRDESC